MDTLSFIGNLASILGFGLSFWGLVITYSVKRQVRNIEREYVQRLSAESWVKELGERTDNISQAWSAHTFARDTAIMAVNDCIALLQSIATESSTGTRLLARQVLAAMQKFIRAPSFWRRRSSELEREELLQILLGLRRLSRTLPRHTADIVNRPSR